MSEPTMNPCFQTRYGTAESVTIESDEWGWELVVETDSGETFRINVHRVQDDLVREVNRNLNRTTRRET